MIERHFDLREPAARFLRHKRLAHLVGVAGSILIGGEGVFNLIARPASPLNYELSFIALVAAVAILLMIRDMRDLPIGVGINGHGFEFDFERGEARSFSWTDSRLQLVILDGRFSSLAIQHPERVSYFVGVRRGFFGTIWPLSVGAYESLMQMAQLKRVTIRPADWSSPLSGQRMISISAIGSHLEIETAS